MTCNVFGRTLNLALSIYLSYTDPLFLCRLIDYIGYLSAFGFLSYHTVLYLSVVHSGMLCMADRV